MVNRDIISEYLDQAKDDTEFAYQNGELVGGRRFQRQQRQEFENERLEDDPYDVHDLDAKIGPLEFVGDFADPDVDVTSKRKTAEHDIVSGVSEFGSEEPFIVQPKGDRPAEIEVTGWIRENQLDVADELINTYLVGVQTGRWTGMGAVERVSIGYNRQYHAEHGQLFEVTVSIIGLSRGTLPDGFRQDDWEPTWWNGVDGDTPGSAAYDAKKSQLGGEERRERLNETMGVKCIVGDLSFLDDFSDPDIEVEQRRNSQDHELVTGHTAYRDEDIEHVTQVMGKQPTKITIDGYVRQSQLETVDRLTELGKTVLISGRWSGTVLPKQADVTYTRDSHDYHGSVFEATIDVLGIQKDVLPETIAQRNVTRLPDPLSG